MTWFKVDDGWARHPKTRKAGRDGRSLWTTAGCECAATGTDGLVSPELLKDYAYLAGVSATKSAAALVVSGLWHDEATVHDCQRCHDRVGDLEPGWHYFHDWNDPWQPTRDEAKDPVKASRWKRKNALSKNRPLCEAIKRRDRNLCRYCAKRVDWNDHRGPNGGSYDHVDPDGTNAFDNVVVACRRCNGRKKDRTPEQAHMPLRPVPTDDPPELALVRTGASSGVGSGVDSESAPSRENPAPHARDGAGRKRTGSELGPELTPGRDGLGPAGEGPVDPDHDGDDDGDGPGSALSGAGRNGHRDGAG